MQGSTLGPLAKLLGLSTPSRPAPLYNLEFQTMAPSDLDLMVIDMPDPQGAPGPFIRDLKLPQGAVITMLTRGKEVLAPKGGTQLMGSGLVQIWPGTPVSAPLLEGDAVVGVRLTYQGVDKKGNPDIRTVLRLHPALAPFKAAVLPLSKKLSPKAEEIYKMLRKDFMVDFDDAGSIGKRYRREDEIGTPWCVTSDFQTLEDDTVTVRDRDTMQQTRMEIGQLSAYIGDMVKF